MTSGPFSLCIKGKFNRVTHCARNINRRHAKYKAGNKYFDQTKVFFHTGNINEEAKNKSLGLKEGEVLLLENIRFFKEEIYSLGFLSSNLNKDSNINFVDISE